MYQLHRRGKIPHSRKSRKLWTLRKHVTWTRRDTATGSRHSNRGRKHWKCHRLKTATRSQMSLSDRDDKSQRSDKYRRPLTSHKSSTLTGLRLCQSCGNAKKHSLPQPRKRVKFHKLSFLIASITCLSRCRDVHDQEGEEDRADSTNPVH